MNILKRFNLISAGMLAFLFAAAFYFYFTLPSDSKNIGLYFIIITAILTAAFFFAKSYLFKKIELLKTASDKEESVIRELALLNEMIGFITSEMKFDAILQKLLDMTRILLKTEHSAIFIFEGKENDLKHFQSTLQHTDQNSILDCAKTMFASALGNVIRNNTAARINTFSAPVPSDHPAISNLLAVPINLPKYNTSALLVTVNKKDGFTPNDEDTLFSFSFQAFHSLLIHKEITDLAVTDGLTGLGNHRAFQERLSLELERAKRYSKPLPLIIFDIDYFKTFNDSYGHQAGDKALKDIAQIIKSNLRGVDFSARYGGEEFIAILPETGYEDAAVVAERIRVKVNTYPFTTESNENARLTISAGIACFPTDAMTETDLIRKTDQSLYFSKEHGRDKVSTYQELLTGTIKEIPAELANILADPELKNVEMLARSIDAKSTYTKNHSLEVASYAVMLGKEFQLDDVKMQSLKVASLLHDIGTIGIPDYVINKPGPLTNEEKSIIQGHPALAEMVLKRYPHIEDILPAILYHHERYDGNGYPLGLKGDDIPVLARILSVSEAYQAMISPRPHRRRKSKKEAIKELEKEAGRQFDPKIVNIFVNILDSKKEKAE